MLVAHLASARERALIAAPFVKAGVLRRLLAMMSPEATVTVVTRWDAFEVASGVSDLDVFDIVAARAGASLVLVDALHAKMYVADGKVLTGSANLTAKALGWCANANVEILTYAEPNCASVNNCLSMIASARPATAEERDRVAAEASSFASRPSSESEDEDPVLAATWFPKLGDPRRLFPIYAGRSLDRMMGSTLEAGERDLAALAIPPGLPEAGFRAAAARAFAAMPAIQRLLSLVEGDLTDEDAVKLVAATPMSDGMPADKQWLVIREWMSELLSDRIEVAPQSFVTRRRPGASR